MPMIFRGRESTVSDAELLLTEPTIEEEERKTSYLELFFDLIFVFAFTQVALLVLEDTSAAGFARSALVLALVWWAWSAYTWMTNAIDIESLVVRLIVLAAMAAGFFMALAVPDAYQDEGVRFAFAYFIVRVLHIALFGWGVRDDPGQRRALLRLAPWFLGAALVVLAGGFVDGDARAYVWLGALMIDVAGTLAPAQAGFRVSPAHFAERFALIVIIALGESIVAIGVATASLDRDWALLRRLRSRLRASPRSGGPTSTSRPLLPSDLSSEHPARSARHWHGMSSPSSTIRSCLGSSSTRSRRKRHWPTRSSRCRSPGAGRSGSG
jgi:low temperature requirement protein LtrA